MSTENILIDLVNNENRAVGETVAATEQNSKLFLNLYVY